MAAKESLPNTGVKTPSFTADDLLEKGRYTPKKEARRAPQGYGENPPFGKLDDRFEGYGLQPVHNLLKIGTALAAEGHTSSLLSTFSASSSAPFNYPHLIRGMSNGGGSASR
jgi:hypothetical protein